MALVRVLIAQDIFCLNFTQVAIATLRAPWACRAMTKAVASAEATLTVSAVIGAVRDFTITLLVKVYELMHNVCSIAYLCNIFHRL